MSKILYLVLLTTFSNNVCPYKILAIISLPLKSHYMAFRPLFCELAARGHTVTVINNFPDETAPANLEFIDLKQTGARPHDFPPMTFYENIDSNYAHIFNYHRHIAITPDLVKADCDILFMSVEVKQHISKGVKYDVIFVEQFMSDCALAFAGAMFDAPIIGIASHVMLPWMYPRLGLPFDVTSDAFYFSKSGPNPSMYRAVESGVLHKFFNSIGRWYIQRNIYEAFKRHLPEYELDVERLAKERMSMLFSYQHFSMTGARVLAPQLLEIGGLHFNKPQPLPQDIEKYLNEAKDGVVYVSFGSNLQASTMSRGKMQHFLEAFRRFRPMKVFFKWENGSLHDNEYLLTRSWFPQHDVLCHPNVKAFITHGGMLGTSEAVSCGVPMVVVPFFGDQFSNAAALEARGVATSLALDLLTADTLATALTEVTKESTERRVKEVAAQFNDRPLSVLDSAIYWTEYVARHGSAPPSLPAKNLTWFESLHLDGYSIVITFILVVFLRKLYGF